MGMGRGRLTYCAIGRLGFIPVMGCEMMKPIEDVLVRHACQARWRVGPGNESGGGGGGGGGRGHGWLVVLEESARTGDEAIEGSTYIRYCRMRVGSGRVEPMCCTYSVSAPSYKFRSSSNNSPFPPQIKNVHELYPIADRYCLGTSETLPRPSPST